MESFYDGDLKDIWDSDLDPAETLKLSTDSDMHDWFLDRDVKDATVILNDRLISDALLNGAVPIKSEHSYSLNSDVDSLPDSPKSLHTKLNDMDEEYYSAIPLKSATSNNLRNLSNVSIDPKCLTISGSPIASSSNSLHSIAKKNAIASSSLSLATATATAAATATATSIFNFGSIGQLNGCNLLSSASSNEFASATAINSINNGGYQQGQLQSLATATTTPLSSALTTMAGATLSFSSSVSSTLSRQPNLYSAAVGLGNGLATISPTATFTLRQLIETNQQQQQQNNSTKQKQHLSNDIVESIDVDMDDIKDDIDANLMSDDHIKSEDNDNDNDNDDDVDIDTNDDFMISKHISSQLPLEILKTDQNMSHQQQQQRQRRNQCAQQLQRHRHLQQQHNQQQQQQQQQQCQYLPQTELLSGPYIGNEFEASASTPDYSRDCSESPDICSDIEIDECYIKNEPLSPASSYKSTPNDILTNIANTNIVVSNTTAAAAASATTIGSVTTVPALSNVVNINENIITTNNNIVTANANNKNTILTGNGNALSLTMANMAAFANGDLVIEHKNGCYQLTPVGQSLLKPQQIILGANGQNILLPANKINIKTETDSEQSSISGINSNGTFLTTTTSVDGKVKISGNVITAAAATASSSATVSAGTASGSTNYGLPLTPPSSHSSDGSDGNLTPEHMVSPQSPTSATLIIKANNATITANNSNMGQQQQQQQSIVNGGLMTVTSIRRLPTATPTSTNLANNNNTSQTSTTSKSGSTTALANAATTAPTSATNSNSTTTVSTNVNVNRGTANGISSTRQPIHTPLISCQPKGSTGILVLTEEEKRTLVAEGYPIPSKLPLTKAEEKSLKKVRRKIKNKISAQESRRKKKEYMDQLEKRVEGLVNENNDYKKRIQTLENSNVNLMNQLHKLQLIVNKFTNNNNHNNNNSTIKKL